MFRNAKEGRGNAAPLMQSRPSAPLQDHVAGDLQGLIDAVGVLAAGLGHIRPSAAASAVIFAGKPRYSKEQERLNKLPTP